MGPSGLMHPETVLGPSGLMHPLNMVFCILTYYDFYLAPTFATTNYDECPAVFRFLPVVIAPIRSSKLSSILGSLCSLLY